MYSKEHTKEKLVGIPKDVFSEIEKSAIENDRSVNKEIVHLIKKGLKK